MEGAWKAERACANQSISTASPPDRLGIRSPECRGLPSPNLLQKHSKVVTKNWSLGSNDGVITGARIVG
jgi:hypothetical protein